MPQFADIADLPEDRRIELIGHRAVDHNETVGFIVEDNKKADRYIDKLKAKHPNIRLIYRGPGPVPDTILVKVGPALN
jgi:hypothetical protein